MEDGINKGIEIGEENKERYAEEKSREKALGIAINCLRKGMMASDIAEITGLTEMEIKQIGAF